MLMMQTCKLLRGVYRDSATLAYEFNLSTLSYLDVPFRPSSPSGASDSGSSSNSSTDDTHPRRRDARREKTPLQRLIDGDEEGVSAYLHEYQHGDSFWIPAESSGSSTSSASPPATRGHAASSIVARNKALVDRERRWEELDPKIVAKRFVSGPAGVYELQEGIFLLCDNYLGPAIAGSLKVRSLSPTPFSN